MTWSTLFRDFIQPVLFAGLFVMTFIGLRISLKNQKRERSKGEKRIVPHHGSIDPSHSPPSRFHGVDRYQDFVKNGLRFGAVRINYSAGLYRIVTFR